MSIKIIIVLLELVDVLISMMCGNSKLRWVSNYSHHLTGSNVYKASKFIGIPYITDAKIHPGPALFVHLAPAVIYILSTQHSYNYTLIPGYTPPTLTILSGWLHTAHGLGMLYSYTMHHNT